MSPTPRPAAAGKRRRSGLPSLLAFWLIPAALAQSAPVDFNNSFEPGHLVYDVGGTRLVGTNYMAQLFLDTATGLVSVPGNGTGLFRRPETSAPGTWSGGTRELPGISYSQTVQLEVRVWDVALFPSYEAAVAAGGITGTSGLFSYQFNPGEIALPSDAWLKNLPSIQLVDQPTSPPLVENITPGIVGEGEPVEIVPKVTGGVEPLTFVWQLAGGNRVTTRTLLLSAETLRPSLVDFDLTVTDAEGRSSPVALFRLEVTNRAPVIRTVTATGALEGSQVHVHATADYAWPANAVDAKWTLEDGRTASGFDTLLPLLSPGQHTAQLQVDELGLVTLYDNLDSITEPAIYHVSTEESGDELILSQTNQVVHEVSIYYYADLAALTPAERSLAGGRLVIYRNDGPLYPGLTSRTPGTKLYESPVFGLSHGYFLQRFTDLNLQLPDRLTWTVIWTNLPQTAGKNAGLVVGDTRQKPASSNVGESYNDYWVRQGEGWELFHFDGFKPVANFASRATGLGASVTAQSPVVSVTFVVTNVPPTITELVAPTELGIGVDAAFRVTATDPGVEPLSVSWNFGDNTALAAGTLANHSYANSGTYHGTVTVNDPFGGHAERAFTVSVAVDRQPLAFVSTPPLEATQDQDYSGVVSANPPGSGQVITVAPVNLPAWLHWEPQSDNSGSGRLFGRPGNSDVGSHAVEFEAADGVNRLRLAFNLVVQDVNDPPTVSAPASVSVPVRRGLANIPVTVADPDLADVLSLTARSLDPSRLSPDLLILGGSGQNRTLTILPSASGAGEVSVELEVNDGKASRRAVISVNLIAPPHFQVAIAPSSGGSLSLDPVAEDYEQDFPLRIRATPAAGWELRRWLGFPDGPQQATALETTWLVTANVTLQGDFADIAAPLVQWISPAPGIVTDAVVTLRGQATDNDHIATLRLRRPDGVVQSLTLENGIYEVPGVQLQDGENRFAVEAFDAAGNATTNSVVLFREAGSVLLVGNAPDTREGRLVSFPIQLKNVRELGGLSFNLRFGDYVDFLGNPAFEASALPEGALVTVNETEPGVVRVVIATSSGAVAPGVHQLGTLRLRVRSLLSARGLQAFLDPELLEVSDPSGNPVPGVGGVSGQAMLLPRTLIGDLNGNDQLDIGDASLLQRLLVGLDPKRSWDTALNDLNHNGALDSGDVLRVMHSVVGLIELPGSPTVGPVWPAARNPQRAALPAESLELTPATATVARSGSFEVQVKTHNGFESARGVRFTLNYPARFLSLKANGGFENGPLIPTSATSQWNSSPQAGKVTFAASSATPWPAPDGVLATFRFQVSDTVPAGWQGRFTLSEVQITGNGYELSQPQGSSGEIALADEQLVPRVSRLRLNDSGALQFDVLANPGTTLVLEGTTELGTGLRGWRPLATRVHNQLPLFLTPEADNPANPPMKFFRLRANAPALASPALPEGSGR